MEPLSIIYLNTAQATTKDLANSRATFTFDPPLTFPSDARLKCGCNQFSFTNYFINISATLANNNFVVQGNAPVATYNIAIPDGSYNVSELSSAINIGVINAGLADGLITLVPDFATNKVLFSISTAGYRIHFPAGTPYALLGTTLNQYIPAGGGVVYTAGAYSELAPIVANFNSILNVYLHTSFSNNSVFNGKQSDVLASIIPTVNVGSVQSYEPFNVIHVDCHELRGASISNCSIYLTDQNNAPISLQDDYSASIQISRVLDQTVKIVTNAPQLPQANV